MSKSILGSGRDDVNVDGQSLPFVCKIFIFNPCETGALAMGRVTCKERQGRLQATLGDSQDLQATLGDSLLLGNETMSARPRYVKFDVFSLGKLEL